MGAHEPAEVAIRDTVTFLKAHLTAGAQTLEVGCGEGQVALELRAHGIRVVGLENDRDRARATRARGVPCALAAWPRFESVPQDAIVFTRSIHHIDPLEGAVVQARALLQPGGVLLIEDFAVHEVAATTLAWFMEVIRSKTASALIEPVPDGLVTELLETDDAEATWTEHHDHVHSFRAIEDAVRSHFEVRSTGTAPYFYRYLVHVLPRTRSAAVFVQSVFEEESRLAARGNIAALGRRMVASRPVGGASWKP